MNWNILVIWIKEINRESNSSGERIWIKGIAGLYLIKIRLEN